MRLHLRIKKKISHMICKNPCIHHIWRYILIKDLSCNALVCFILSCLALICFVFLWFVFVSLVFFLFFVFSLFVLSWVSCNFWSIDFGFVLLLVCIVLLRTLYMACSVLSCFAFCHRFYCIKDFRYVSTVWFIRTNPSKLITLDRRS